jgi:hypothetical protein
VFLTSKLITCFIDGFTLKRELQSIVHLLTMNWDIYILDFLEDEVHSIWDI